MLCHSCHSCRALSMFARLVSLPSLSLFVTPRNALSCLAQVNTLSEEVPLVAIIKAMGITSDQEVMQLIGADPNTVRNCVVAWLRGCVLACLLACLRACVLACLLACVLACQRLLAMAPVPAVGRALALCLPAPVSHPCPASRWTFSRRRWSSAPPLASSPRPRCVVAIHAPSLCAARQPFPCP